jgi:hypothetical protein
MNSCVINDTKMLISWGRHMPQVIHEWCQFTCKLNNVQVASFNNESE